MKKLLFILFLLISGFVHSQTPSTIYIVPTLSNVSTYFGNANRLYVVSVNQDYVRCSPCYTDSILGAAGRKWRKMSDSTKLGLLGADFERVNDSLRHSYSVNPVDFGADPTGVANSITSFLAAIATGEKVVPSPGTYLINGSAGTTLLTLNIGQTLEGTDVGSVILKTTSNAYMLRTKAFSIVKNITIQGSSSKSVSNQYQTGLFAMTDDTGFVMQNLILKNWGGNSSNIAGAIYVAAITNGNTIGGTIDNVNIYDSYNGVCLNSRAEYISSSNLKISNCHIGFYNESGNSPASLLTIQNCDTGYVLMNGTNSAHSVLANSEINHNTYNLVVDGITAGNLFDGVMFNVGNVIIRNSTGIRFNDCDFSTGTITLTNNTNLYRSGLFVMTKSLVSGEDFNVFGQTKLNSTPVTLFNQANVVDTAYIYKGPMYHTGITPASVSVLDSFWSKRATDGRSVLTAQTAGNGIYGGSGSLPGNVAVALSGFTLNFNQGANSLLSINPTVNGETVELLAFNTTGGDNQARFSAATTDVSGQFFFQASFNGEATNAEITGNAISGLSSLEYEADTHEFTGTVIIPTPFTLGAVSVLPTGTELNFVDGVTSAIQTQLNAKQPLDADLTIVASIGTALQQIRVNAGATALEYFTPSAGGGTVTDVTGTAPIVITGTSTVTPNVTITQATTSTNGYLSSTDWNTFNNKGSGNVTKVGTPVDNQLGVWTGDGTIEGDANFTWSGAQFVVKGAATSTAGIDLFNGAFGSILIGADNNLITRTNSTNKHGGIALAHYTNAEEPFLIARGVSTTSQNIVAYGSGTNPGYNSATNHEFYTATNNTTLTGTLRLSVANTIAYFSGINVGIGVTAPDRLLHSELSDATTNTIVYPFRISHVTSGTAAIGGGVGIEMETENASNTMRVTGSITNPMTDATNATEDVDMVFSNMIAGTLTEQLRLSTTNATYIAAGTTYTLAKTLTATATLDFGNTLAGTVSDLTVTVTGAAEGDAVSIGVPNGSYPATGTFTAWISAANTVTIRYANNSLTLAQDPASGTFRASVVKY